MRYDRRDGVQYIFITKTKFRKKRRLLSGLNHCDKKIHFQICSIIFSYQGILSKKKFPQKNSGTLTTTGVGGG